MSRTLFVRLTSIGLVLLFTAMLAPVASAQGPGPSGTFSVTFYNFVSDEGGAACPSGGTYAGTEDASNTFHFWGEGAGPYSGATGSNYTVCWDGWLNFPQSGDWNVQTTNDDGMDVYVDGQITMQAWYDQGPTQHLGTINLGTGSHHVIIKYYNRGLAGTACVGWQLSGNAIANWRCPSSPTTNYYPTPIYYYPTPVPTPVYAPPPYTAPYGQPYGQTTTVIVIPCWACLPQLNGQVYTPNGQPYTPYYVPGSYCTYRVQRGDTLSAIALRYRTSYWVLAQVNRLYNPSLIYAGMLLYVPNCR